MVREAPAVQKKKLCRAGWGGCGSQGNAALPLFPLGPAGPRLWRQSPLRPMCSVHVPQVWGPRPGRCSPGQTCWSEPIQPLPTPAPIIINTGLDVCSHCGAEDKVSSQVTEVKRVPALALHSVFWRGRLSSSKELPYKDARTMGHLG